MSYTVLGNKYYFYLSEKNSEDIIKIYNKLKTILKEKNKFSFKFVLFVAVFSLFIRYDEELDDKISYIVNKHYNTRNKYVKKLVMNYYFLLNSENILKLESLFGPITVATVLLKNNDMDKLIEYITDNNKK